MDLYVPLFKVLKTEGGFTISAGSLRPVNYNSGYAVGGKSKVLTGKMDSLTFTKFKVKLSSLRHRGGLIGGWVDSKDNKYYLEATQYVSNKSTALSMANSRGEIAIWDFKNTCEIRLTEIKTTKEEF